MLNKATKNVLVWEIVKKAWACLQNSYITIFARLNSSTKHKILLFYTVAAWDAMGRVMTQTYGQAF